DSQRRTIRSALREWPKAALERTPNVPSPNKVCDSGNSPRRIDMIGSTQPDVAIIGAGPYALSIAAHLQAEGVDFRIFGPPLETWRAHMPKGMFLKSEGFASNLFDPARSFSLGQYCAEEGMPYGDESTPVPLQTFVEYGLAFQRRFVPSVEN